VFRRPPPCSRLKSPSPLIIEASSSSFLLLNRSNLTYIVMSYGLMPSSTGWKPVMFGCPLGSTTYNSAAFWQSQHAALDVHEGVKCDGCGSDPLRGIRWKCHICETESYYLMQKLIYITLKAKTLICVANARSAMSTTSIRQLWFRWRLR
jgi:hypothetical protein